VTPKVRRIAAIVTVLLLSLLVNLTWQQVVKAEEYRSATGNQRQLLDEYSRQRGPILVGGAGVAQSVATDGALKYLRVYKSGEAYAPATGFYSLVYGATGLEKTENEVLSGSDSRFLVDRFSQLFAGRAPKGGAVRLTLDGKAQQAAYEGLAGRTGAVVAIDPRTGAILALASSPSFDPNRLSSHSPAAIRAAYDEYSTDPKRPLLNRPLAQTLPPGSTFKLVTAAAALESGNYTPDSELPGPASIVLPETTRPLNNWTGQPCGPNDVTTLTEALVISCNTAFASLGVELGQDALRAQAEKFGFGTNFDIPLKAAASVFPSDLDTPQTGMAAIGQFDVRATALQMAMVAAGIGNNGSVMRPYLVQQVLAPDLSVLENTQPQQFSTALTPEHAAQLQNMMVDVVEKGTGSNARIPGVRVGGKTGTAQSAPGKPPHAWFVSVAGLPDPRVAVAVVLENGGGAAEISGNKLAAPIARAVMEAVLRP